MTVGCARDVKNLTALTTSTLRGRASTMRRDPGPGIDRRRRIGLDLIVSVGDRSSCGARPMGPHWNSNVVGTANEEFCVNART